MGEARPTQGVSEVFCLVSIKANMKKLDGEGWGYGRTVEESLGNTEENLSAVRPASGRIRKFIVINPSGYESEEENNTISSSFT